MVPPGPERARYGDDEGGRDAVSEEPNERKVFGQDAWGRDERGEVFLSIQVCSHCQRRFFPDVRVCPYCFEQGALDRTRVFGPGTLYSYSTVHVAPKQFRPPYTIGYVDFEPNLRVFGRIQTEDASRLSVDMPVRLVAGTVKWDGDDPVEGYLFEPQGK